MKHFLSLSLLLMLLLSFAGSTAVADTNYFSVNVYFDSATEDVNAFEASLKYPSSWSVEGVTLKDSDLIYWIQNPQAIGEGDFSFSGIFPGGVQNSKNYSSPLQLFTVDFSGDLDLATQLALGNSSIYLNHPMALEATEAFIDYELDPSAKSVVPSNFSALDHLDYEFVTDPISGKEALVINTFRGALASYTFEVKEGDFGRGGWSSVNGVRMLNSDTSTVELFVASPSGDEERFVLRSSMARYGLMVLGVAGGTGLILYLFFLAAKTLRVDMPSPKISARERTKFK